MPIRWLAFVWTECLTTVLKTWEHPDPEFSKPGNSVGQGWLAMQGRRKLGFFNNCGIPFQAKQKAHLSEHKLVTRWDREIGPVEFIIPKLDDSRYYKWKCLRDGDWKRGVWYLTVKEELGKDNKKHLNLKAVMTYTLPASYAEKKVDKKKRLFVEFTDDPENAIVMYTHKKYEADKISAVEALAWLDELEILKSKFKNQKKAVGNPHKHWGSSKLNKVINIRRFRLTERTKNGKKERNHLWTRRIVDRAVQYQAGDIFLKNLPEKELCGRSWAWHQFKSFLEYKIEQVGGKLTAEKKETDTPEVVVAKSEADTSLAEPVEEAVTVEA